MDKYFSNALFYGASFYVGWHMQSWLELAVFLGIGLVAAAITALIGALIKECW